MSKGQFQKGNKAATKKASKKDSYSFMNTVVPSTPIEKKETDVNNNEYQPFGIDNDFPQALASLNRKSPVHRALLNSKTFYITGNKFLTEDKKLDELINEVNNDKESLRDVHRKLTFDKLSSGNSYLQLVYDASNTWVKLHHIDYTKCRVSKDGKSILIHPKWSEFDSNKDLVKSIPLYPEFKNEKGLRYSMIHVKDYEPEYQYYGLPSSIAGLDSAGIAYKTNKWNVSRLDNDFKTSGVLVVDSDFSDEDAKSFKEDFENKFTGEDNQGKLLMINTNGGADGNGTKFTPVTNATEGDWLNLHKQSSDELVISHSWFRSLAGLAQEGALGNTQAIKNEYSIAMSTIVNDEQRSWLDIYKSVLDNFSYNTEDLVIVNKSPISDTPEVFGYHIDAGIVSKNEMRERLGFEPLIELEEKEEKEKDLLSKLAIMKAATDAGLEVNEAKKLAGL